jgi:ribosomal protein L11 methylase PrmA
MTQQKYDLSTNNIDFSIMKDDRVWGDGTHETTQHMMKLIDSCDIKDKSVIEVGVGTGILSILCGKKGAKHIIGFDLDPIALEWARRNFKTNNIENAEVMINDLTRYYDETADIVIANLPFSPQIDNCHLIKKNMHQDSLFIMTWWKGLPFEQHVFGFEVIDHIIGEEYDGYILKLAK